MTKVDIDKSVIYINTENESMVHIDNSANFYEWSEEDLVNYINDRLDSDTVDEGDIEIQ